MHSIAIFSFSFFFSTRCTFLFSRVHTGRVNGFQISNISDRRQSRPAGVRCTRMVSLLACCRKSRYRLWAFRIAVTRATIHAWFLITWCAQDIPMARRILVRWALSRVQFKKLCLICVECSQKKEENLKKKLKSFIYFYSFIYSW